MGFLESIDFFGTEYSFFINLKKKYYNKFGGITTIITAIICLFIFYIMSKNDFSLKKPKSIYNYEVSDRYQKFKFSEQKIKVPWRIVTYNKTLVNYENVIYPYIHYYKSTFGKDAQENKTLINSVLCNQTDINSYPELISLSFDTSTIYCLNTDDLDLGGILYDEDSYIKFEISLCKNGIDYDEKNPNCTSTEKLKEAMGDTFWSVEFYFPEFEFDPNDYKTPFRSVYKNHLVYLSKYTYKLENIYFKENIVSDNDDFFSGKRRNYTYYGYDRNEWSTYLLAKDDLLKDGTNSRIFELNIKLAFGARIYMRDYKDLFDIIANIWPIISFIFYLTELIVNEIKVSLINYHLCKYVFIDLKNNEAEMKINPIQFKRNFNPNEVINNELENNSVFSKNNNDLSQMNVNSNYCIINRHIRPAENLNKKNKTTLSKPAETYVNKIYINNNKKLILKRKNDSSINQNIFHLKFKYFLCAEIFDIFFLKGFLKKMPLKFRKLNDNMRKVMDVSTYIKSIIKLNMVINLDLPLESRKLVRARGRMSDVII